MQIGGIYHLLNFKQTTKEMNIQDEVQKIHHKFGTSEMANYEIQFLFDKEFES